MAVFDLLASPKHGDVRRRPYIERRGLLLELLADCRLPLLVVPSTQERAAALKWLTDHSAAGIEGVVAKRADQTYNPARVSWRKIRTRLSAEAIVGGVVGEVGRPHALVLGRLDEHARLRLAGRTAPLPVEVRAEIGRRLRAANEHPWPTTLPPRFNEQVPLIYTRVEPSVVVELDVDTARDRGWWRHPVAFRRIRPDLQPEDLTSV